MFGKELSRNIRLRLARPTSWSRQQASRLGGKKVWILSDQVLDGGETSHLQALARGENVDELVSLTLPPAADRDGEEEEEGGDDGEDDGDDHGAEASPPQTDQLGAHLAEGADIHLVVRGQLGLVWFAWKVADETKE